MIAETKVCLSCNHHINGRADKKFCNNFCRNAHHNQLNSDGNNYIRNINHALRRNRRVLEELLLPAKLITKTTKRIMQNKGFSFHYYTHCSANKKGNRFHFCYEYGYRVVGKEQVLIVRKKCG
ncbi:MAG: hypothetical protein JWQ30_925 [Sediminibacterium sp.]|nr:hypothetical protein [Sediminibacterium sp.]